MRTVLHDALARVLEAEHDVKCAVRPQFSLRKLVSVQHRVEQVARDGSFVHPFTAEQLAIIAYALGVMSAERLKAGDRLDDPEPEGTS